MHERSRQKLLLLFAVFFGLALAAIHAAQEEAQAEISDEDRAEVIRLTLDYALVKKSIPDYNFIKDPKNVPLSTRDISADLLPKLDGINLILLTPDEIEQRAEKDGSYFYFLEFGEIKAEGETISVTINHNPKYAKKPKVKAFGGSVEIKYRKQDGKWKGEVASWVIA